MRDPVAEAIRAHLNDIIELLGYDRSESSTEAFAGDLFDVIHGVMERVEESHEEGLCWDCSTDIAYSLVDQNG